MNERRIVSVRPQAGWLIPTGACLALLMLSALSTAAAPATHYMGRQIATTMHYSGAPWLVRESRQREEDCEQLLAQLNVQPGQTVCDVGCGNGFYTLKLAEATGKQGKVYAVDIQREMLTMLRLRARESRIENLVPVHSTITDPRLPAAALDLVLLVDVDHEFSHPAEMLKAIRSSLKPTGRIALAEFRAEDPNVPIKPEHKMTREQARLEWEANGFALVASYDELPWQHVLFFEVAEDS